MRGFFVLLLLTNMVYFAWQFYIAPPTMEEGVAEFIRPGERLVIIAELPDSERPLLRSAFPDITPGNGIINLTVLHGNETPAPEVVIGSRNIRCVVVTNITEQSQIDMLTNILQDSGASHIEQGEESGVRINYWVMLPPQANRREAELLVRQFTEQRISDYFIVRSGDYENAISLGVYSSLERAQRRIAQIEQLGSVIPAARIEHIELPTKQFQLRYRIGGDAHKGLREKVDVFGRVDDEPCH